MCGRFTVTASKKEIKERFEIENDDQLTIDFLYNAAPSQKLITITSQQPKKVQLFKWGLIPSWAKDPSIGFKMINARSETLDQKVTFKKLLKNRRCIVPADSFYEWDKILKTKQPYRVMLKDKNLFSFAALWDEWVNKKTGEIIKSFAIITTEANSLVKKIHNRMPVILNEETEKTWLNDSLEQGKLLKILKPYSAEKMIMYPVSKKVNTPKNDFEEVIKEVEIKKDSE